MASSEATSARFSFPFPCFIQKYIFNNHLGARSSGQYLNGSNANINTISPEKIHEIIEVQGKQQAFTFCFCECLS
jgi:hypothetical protein